MLLAKNNHGTFGCFNDLLAQNGVSLVKFGYIKKSSSFCQIDPDWRLALKHIK